MKQSLRAKRIAMAALTAAFTLAFAGCSSGGSSDPEGSDKIVLGYYAGDAPIVYKSVTSYSTYLNAVVAARYGIDSSCAVTGSLPNTELLPFDKANGISTFAGVVNSDGGGFDADLGHSALVTDKDAMIANLVTLTKDGGFDGLNLDFENLYSADRDDYTQFVTELATKLHTGGYKLILSVAAKGAEDPSDDWSYPFDYPAIGKVADLLQLMTYDENGPDWSGPGPIAGADWVEKCIVYATSVVSPSKLLIGLPAYGYDWDLTTYANTGSYPSSFVAWTSFSDWLGKTGAVEHWNDIYLSPSVTYTTEDAHSHEAWFENAKSIEAKTALAKKYELAGISVFALGQEDLSYWQAAMAGLK